MQKIAILGGGIGALTTAFELTNDPHWKEQYDITMYQLGWRMGGKGASGRNRTDHQRIQEHGLHIWMGFYENAFHMMRRAYDECSANGLIPKNSPFQHAEDAFSPVSYTPVMEQVGNEWQIWNISWPAYNAFPGEDSLFVNRQVPPTPWGFVLMLLNRLVAEFEETVGKHPVLTALYKTFAGELTDEIGKIPQLPPNSVPEKHTWLHRLEAFAHLMPADPAQHAVEDLELIVTRLEKFSEDFLQLVWDVIEKDAEVRHAVIIINTVISAVVGMIKDRVVQEGFQVIEQYEVRQWLQSHGCRFPNSPIIVGMYDSAFSYRDGNPQQAEMGAGTMLYGALRLMLTYRGAFMWHMNAGMGETIMTPIYLALKNRGVKFEFFHKVTNLGLSDDKKRIERVDLDVQATIKPEYPDGYYPLFIASDNIPCWPTEPFWEQLVEGEAIQKASNHDLESWWNNAPIAGKKTLQRGQDFDLVVLGISLGAFQYICTELIAARQDSWAPMVNNVATVRTQGLQLWLHKTAQELGWAGATPVLTSYREPFDTWSDMSHLIPHEHWPPQDNVQQIAYFCNAMPTPKNTPPFSESGYPQEEWRSVLENAREFVGEWLGPIWPKPGNPNQPGKFDWSLLVNPGGGADPLAAQFVRANIDPTELYVLSLPKTAQYRLASGDSRFENLYLAGDWTFTDLNVGCIEATVISGRMASQAICGRPNHIYGSFGYVIPIAQRATA